MRSHLWSALQTIKGQRRACVCVPRPPQWTGCLLVETSSLPQGMQTAPWGRQNRVIGRMLRPLPPLSHLHLHALDNLAGLHMWWSLLSPWSNIKWHSWLLRYSSYLRGMTYSQEPFKSREFPPAGRIFEAKEGFVALFLAGRWRGHVARNVGAQRVPSW